MRSTNIVWWESFGLWKLSLNFPFVHPACTFFFFDWEKSWLDMFTFCTFLSISLFLSLNFFFVHPASHKRLCLQTLDLAERKVGWTCLYFALFQSWFDMFKFCTFLREKLMENFYILREKLIGRVYILLFFEREKLMWNVYISRKKMIGHVYNLQLFSPFNFSFHWTQYLFIQLLIKCT